MDWILLAITITSSGTPNDYRQIAQFETRAVCEFAMESLSPLDLRHTPIGDDRTTAAMYEANGQSLWTTWFKCIPTTTAGVTASLDNAEQEAKYAIGRNDAEENKPWWEERLDRIRSFGR